MEVSKFVGASLRTVSGIRGTVKKAMRPGPGGALPGSFRAAFEDKLVHSDTVMLKAWVAVDVPRFFNPVTNLLAHPVKAARGVKARAVHKRSVAADADDEALQGVLDAAASNAHGNSFMPADRFKGPRAGTKFCLGPRGLGYYKDLGANTGYGVPGAPVATTAAAPDQPGAETGWVGARTVAQMRRELGMGAPRQQDSMYKAVERVERIFPALRVPKALQKALPFASKPKIQAPRNHSTLEQRRAVPLDKPEKKVCSIPHAVYAQCGASANTRVSLAWCFADGLIDEAAQCYQE